MSQRSTKLKPIIDLHCIENNHTYKNAIHLIAKLLKFHQNTLINSNM